MIPGPAAAGIGRRPGQPEPHHQVGKVGLRQLHAGAFEDGPVPQGKRSSRWTQRIARQSKPSRTASVPASGIALART